MQPSASQLVGKRLIASSADRTRERLLDAATETLNRVGIQGATTREIAWRAGVNEVTLFRHFKSKEQLLRAILKRGLAATLEEWLMAAEYVMAGGNYNVILCERGVRTFADHTRNTLDLSVVPAIKRMSHLPILVDPSHGTGKRTKVLPMSRAAIAVGADGVLIEVHHKPEEALSDGPQAILPEAFEQLVREVDAIAQVLGRSLQPALAAR